MWNKLKLIVGVFGLSGILIIVSCGPELTTAIDPEEQLAIDVELIEEYLQSKNITDYDTLEGGERVYVINEGTGEALQYNDIVSYEFIGRMLNDTIFDTTIAQMAYDQDIASAITEIIFANDGMGGMLFDVNGLARLEKLPSFRAGYSPIYTGGLYQAFVVTHTQGAWAIQQQNLISGVKHGLEYTLENTKIGGSAVVIMPSYLAYGNTLDPNYANVRNKALIFELRPVRRR